MKRDVFPFLSCFARFSRCDISLLFEAMLCKPVCVFLCLAYYTSGDIVLEVYHFFFLRGHVSHGDILFATEGKWCLEVQHLVWISSSN